MLLVLAMLLQVSSDTTVCTAHVPSACGFGAKSGKEPGLQQACWPGVSEEQKDVAELYLVKSVAEILHSEASVAQESPDLTCTVVQSARGRSRERVRKEGLSRVVVFVVIGGWLKSGRSKDPQGTAVELAVVLVVMQPPADHAETAPWTKGSVLNLPITIPMVKLDMSGDALHDSM